MLISYTQVQGDRTSEDRDNGCSYPAADYEPKGRRARPVHNSAGLLASAVFLTYAWQSALVAQTMATSQGDLQVAPVVTGLDVPWGFDFLPGGGIVVTEREGDLLLVQNGQARSVRGVPDVVAAGQGGLLDVLVAEDFASSNLVYLSYAKKVGQGSATAIARAQLDLANARLVNLDDIFVAAPASTTGRHYGSRMAEGPDGYIYFTIGDRGDRPSAQSLASHNGSVLRIHPDGRVPNDNPFVSRQDALPEIWSFGHRNPQGLGFSPDGQLWAVEHGARGGDEVNHIRPGANYGWPIIAYGRHYSGLKIGEGTERDGMEQPAYYWDPSMAPSNLMVYSGKMWPEWEGDVFVGSLKFNYIARLSETAGGGGASGQSLTEVEQLKSVETGRIRDVREAPDGSIWFASQGDGAIYRLSR
ncbi:PQQ-dependent sugar dehydrogenase [Phaeobacter sp.]|uniref:PQQ-dependent sugar dehydrogenase n=1 Tax=Phaeobacter sp. TaxID=1902409 RepID=UPI00345924A5